MTQSLPLYAVVFISGASVLALEILGTRVLGPFYGVSIFLWSALISITLAALSVGYLVGGRWADRSPSPKRLGWVLLAAGVLVVALPWLKYPVLRLCEPLGLRTAVLVAATVLFGPPLTLLGVVSPYAIRLRTARVDEVGRNAGDIYAISTLASVASALLVGFVLVPEVGVFRLIVGIGGLLLIASAIAFAMGRTPRTAVVAALLAIAGFLPMASPGQAMSSGLLTVRQSPYAELRVWDWEGMRVLGIDGGTHTLAEKGTWRSLFPYAVVVDLVKHFYPEPGRMLLIGLGGGSVAKSFHHTGWTVDAVEIDPGVVELAYEFFGLEPADATVAVQDGREFLLSRDTAYDLIVMDAFGSSAIPFHLVTEEAFGLVKSRLTPDGVLAINIEQNGWDGKLSRSLAATLRRHFSEVSILPIAEPPTELGNLILLAANRPLEFSEEVLGRPRDFLDDPYLHWMVLQRNHAWDNRFEPAREDAIVLTDDRNPVELWAEEINLIARRKLHKDFEWADLAW